MMLKGFNCCCYFIFLLSDQNLSKMYIVFITTFDNPKSMSNTLNVISIPLTHSFKCVLMLLMIMKSYVIYFHHFAVPNCIINILAIRSCFDSLYTYVCLVDYFILLMFSYLFY